MFKKFLVIRGGKALPDPLWYRSWRDDDLEDWVLKQELQGHLEAGDRLQTRDRTGTYIGDGEWDLAAA